MITLKQLKDKLHKDFGWENLESDDNKWFVDNLLKDTIQAIEVIRCCETLKDDSEYTFELEINNQEKTKELTEQLKELLSKPSKMFFIDKDGNRINF